MTTLNRITSILAIVFGLLGILGCIAILVGVWAGNSRLNRATETMFGYADDTLVNLRERVAKTRQRVHDSRITAEGIEQSLKEWTRSEARQRLGDRFNVEEKAEQLTSGLAKADRWLELSETSTEIVRQALSAGESSGAPVNTELADRLLKEIGTLRGDLAQVTELIERIKQRTTDADGDGTLKQRINQAAQLALRLLATLSSIETRLAELDVKMGAMQEEVQHWKAATRWWLLVAALCLSLLTVWMAAGQVAMCRGGWMALRRSGTSRQPSDDERSA